MGISRAGIASSVLLQAFIVGILTCPPALSQEQRFEISGGGYLTVEGDRFTFELRPVEVNGSTCVEEVAVWEGGVTAEFSGITLETERFQVGFSGEEVSRLEAGPEVKVTGLGGRASFHCRDVEIELPTGTNGLPGYKGVCSQARGSYIATGDELGVEGAQEYQVNFLAERVQLDPDRAVLEWPELSLGNLDHPDVALTSRELTLHLGVNRVTGERGIIGASVPNASLRVFGLNVHFLQFPYYRGFVKVLEPGWGFELPRVGSEGGEGPFVDQTATYNFLLDGFTEGPEFRARVQTFPFARTYAELGLSARGGDLIFDLRAGYRREEDSDNEPVVLRAEPEFTLELARQDLGNGLGFACEAFAGHMNEISTGVEADRWGCMAKIDWGPSPGAGYPRLSGELLFRDLYYGTGENYRVLEAAVRLRHVESPRWGATLSYVTVADWGETPFAFDMPGFRDELRLREHTRLGKRWGCGFEWAWDLEEDEFGAQEIHATYIFDSVQVSVGWDFATDSLGLRFDLPGSLR